MSGQGPLEGVWVVYAVSGTVFGIYADATAAVNAHGEDGYTSIKFVEFGKWSPS